MTQKKGKVNAEQVRVMSAEGRFISGVWTSLRHSVDYFERWTAVTAFWEIALYTMLPHCIYSTFSYDSKVH